MWGYAIRQKFTDVSGKYTGSSSGSKTENQLSISSASAWLLPVT
jgi:hypothetical protein